MKTEIYYFTGTGNSLRIAKELKTNLSESELIPIVSSLAQNVIKTNANIVGMVFPIYAFDLPWMVEDFIKRLQFENKSYIFAISSRRCSYNIFKKIDMILLNQNMRLSLSSYIDMPQNYIPIFKVWSSEKIEKANSKMQRQASIIHSDIKNRNINLQKKDHWYHFFITKVLFPMFRFYYQKIGLIRVSKTYYANDFCSGCGLCTKICIVNRIKLKNRKPFWVDETKCAFCFACIHHCPKSAIQIKHSSTFKKSRYSHPEIAIKEIMNQKKYLI